MVAWRDCRVNLIPGCLSSLVTLPVFDMFSNLPALEMLLARIPRRPLLAQAGVRMYTYTLHPQQQAKEATAPPTGPVSQIVASLSSSPPGPDMVTSEDVMSAYDRIRTTVVRSPLDYSAVSWEILLIVYT